MFKLKIGGGIGLAIILLTAIIVPCVLLLPKTTDDPTTQPSLQVNSTTAPKDSTTTSTTTTKTTTTTKIDINLTTIDSLVETSPLIEVTLPIIEEAGCEFLNDYLNLGDIDFICRINSYSPIKECKIFDEGNLNYFFKKYDLALF